MTVYEPRRYKTLFVYAETKTQISAFVFATKAVHFFYILNLKFQASSIHLLLYSPICVEFGQKPRRLVLSSHSSYTKLLISLFYAAPKMKNMAVTGCLYHSSRSFKGYVYLFIYKQFIISIELNRIETLN